MRTIHYLISSDAFGYINCDIYQRWPESWGKWTYPREIRCFTQVFF